MASCVAGELIPCAFIWHDPGIIPMLQKSPWRSWRIKIRNNRIGTNGLLNLEGSVRSRGENGQNSWLRSSITGATRKRPPASRGNPHTGDFNPAPAGDHALDARRREPSVDQLDQKLGVEPVGQHDRLGAAVDGCLKQFERLTARLLKCRHRCAPSSLAFRL
jgi:hypothetical protein